MAYSTYVVHSDRHRLKEVKKFDETKIGVKGLVDSGITSIPEIFVHDFETLETIKESCNSTCIDVPLIDLTDYKSPTQRQKIIEQVKEACMSWGFFQVINHGIPTSVLDDTVAAIRAFHHLPQHDKAKYYNRDEIRARGVTYSSNDDLYRSKAATWHDSLQVWYWMDRPKDDEIPGVCRNEVANWEGHATEIGEVLSELLCEGLGLEPTKFKDLTFLESRVIVGHCYPPCPQPNRTLGLESHADPGTLTVLLQNHVPGLQVKYQDQWVDVKPVHGGLIINVGDFIQILCNDAYKSSEHRVVANSNEERISIGVFFHVGTWKESKDYGPLPELLSTEKPPRYRIFKLQEYLTKFYSKVPHDTKPFREHFRN